jgi:hypothetical protein
LPITITDARLASTETTSHVAMTIATLTTKETKPHTRPSRNQTLTVNAGISLEKPIKTQCVGY